MFFVSDINSATGLLACYLLQNLDRPMGMHTCTDLQQKAEIQEVYMMKSKLFEASGVACVYVLEKYITPHF